MKFLDAMTSRSISAGDLIQFSGYYEMYVSPEGNEIIMSSIPKRGIVLDVKNGYITVFSGNQVYLMNLGCDSAVASRI